MTLSDIIRSSANRMAGVHVDMQLLHETVLIAKQGENDVFLQGDDARRFIKEYSRLYSEAGDVTEHECAAHVAEPYTELWEGRFEVRGADIHDTQLGHVCGIPAIPVAQLGALCVTLNEIWNMAYRKGCNDTRKWIEADTALRLNERAR